MTPPVSPLVSMIVLCYNQSRFVVETLDSVKAQTYKHTEWIIVDDCSSDDSVAIIQRWLNENGISCVFIRHQKNLGICKSLNEALAASRGKYISMIASDDVWLPDKISTQVEIMEAQSDDVGIVYSDAFQTDEHGRSLPDMFIASCRHFSEIPQGRILDALLGGNFVGGMTTLIRRSCFDVVGQYDEALPFEDSDMWLRIARHYSFVYSPVTSAKYRIHSESLSHSKRPLMLDGAIKLESKQLRFGNLNQQQEATLRRVLAEHRKELTTLHLEMAHLARQNGDRSAAKRHLVASFRAGGMRPAGSFITWASLLAYSALGLRRLRWWKAVSPENGKQEPAPSDESQ